MPARRGIYRRDWFSISSRDGKSTLGPNTLIGLSMHGEGEVAERMRRAGAVTYLAKSSALEDLVAAIRACKPEAAGKT
jgi:DNA-binding NarL/FixJ family response regulator